MNVDSLYGDAAQIGKWWAVVSAVIGTFVAIGMIIGGIYIIYHRSYLQSVQGKVVKSSYDCTTTKTPTCKVDITYSVNNTTYNKTFTSAKMYKVGDTVDVYYNPNDVSDSEINPLPKWLGWASIGGAIFVVILSWIWVWLVNKYKFLAAAEGVKGVYTLLK